MVLKENWTSQDKFNYNNINDIYNTINLIEEKLGINSNFQTTTKRNIQVGDDLSGKIIFLEFPDDLENKISDSMTLSEKIDDSHYKREIFSTNKNHNISENVEILARFENISVQTDDSIVLYLGEADGWQQLVNLKQIQLADDFGIVQTLNSDVSPSYQYMYIIEKKAKKIGDFLYAEDLQKIEDNIEIIAQCVNTSFNKRNWYYLSVITYEDINRWSILLNYAYEVVFEESRNIVTENEELLITEDDYYLMTEGG